MVRRETWETAFISTSGARQSSSIDTSRVKLHVVWFHNQGKAGTLAFANNCGSLNHATGKRPNSALGNRLLKFERPDECEEQSFHSVMRMRWIIYRQMVPKTYSTREKRNPIQLCGPAKNVRRFAQTPGISLTASGSFSHRSGLRQDRQSTL